VFTKPSLSLNISNFKNLQGIFTLLKEDFISNCMMKMNLDSVVDFGKVSLTSNSPVMASYYTCSSSVSLLLEDYIIQIEFTSVT
jgi:hypothetical protein